MNRLLLTFLASLALSLTAIAQELPQFTSSNFDGWVYSNASVALTSSNISSGNIVLYVSRYGDVVTLVSPPFQCAGIDSIKADVKWFTRYINNSEFDISKTALTMVLDDENGIPIDSVTSVPTQMVTSHDLTLTLAVPAGTGTARLRFVSWKANSVSSGAIKRALFTAITATPPDEPMSGDIDGNGIVNVTDATLLIQSLLYDTQVTNADMDNNGIINISDATLLIDYVLRH